MSNEELRNNILDWLSMDNEIKSLQKKIRDIRKEKKNKTNEIVEVMKSHEIACFDTSDGKLIYTQQKTKAPLSKKHLINSLSNYFNNDPENVKKLSEYILSTRKDKITETIKRKIKKKQ
tara:strand:+ start:206 stop:562 length:357 start_codon:yes stop_codon:yes gene_type:complete